MTEQSLETWLFRAIMFEAGSQALRAAEIRVGADQTLVETNLMEEVLGPFSVQLRSEAMRMTRAYALIYCFENSVRDLIRDRLTEKHGADWWNSTAVPNKKWDWARKLPQHIIRRRVAQELAAASTSITPPKQPTRRCNGS